MAPWLHKKIHVSWLVAWCAAAVIAGVALSVAWHTVLLGTWPWLIVAGCLAGIAGIMRIRAAILLVVVAGSMIGLWRGSAEQQNLARYQPLFGQIVTLRGTASEDTSYGPHGDQRIMLGDVHAGTMVLPGHVWVSSDYTRPIKRSDTVVLQGKLGPGFGGIAASMTHASIVSVARTHEYDIGLRVRDWFASGIHVAIPEPESSLASGYLVGERSALPEDLDNQLRVVGLTHAVVASGYNLTILVSFARQLLAGISKYVATISAAALIAGFMMISGLSPSMSRAGLVTGLSLGAWYYGRRIHPFVLLPFAAALTALLNPSYVWGDIGWYLSFTSFGGVIVLAPIAQRFLWGTAKHVGFIRQTIVDTMSAQVATLPVMMYAFGHYSPYALLANILVLPLIPLTMLLTFIAGIAGLVVPGAASLFGLPATFILKYMTAVVARVADLPGAQGDITVSLGIVVLLYLCILLAIWWLKRVTLYDFRQPEPFEDTAN